MTRRSLVVLGATGSIGLQALEVADRLDIAVVGLAARVPSGDLAALAERHPHAAVAVSGGSGEERSTFLDRIPRAAFGMDEVVRLAATPGCTVVNGIVGAVGLVPSLAAIEAGNRLALANKESMVAGGELVRRALEVSAGELVPVDSEHSALFQLLDHTPTDHVDRLVLTASGGPFRGRSAASLDDVTPDEALAHPTWTMGRRITIDSATLANKGLEVIEAHLLFDVPYDRIDVVVHPQSVVHSLVQLTDGALLAHLGATDMRVPIQYAITHPRRERQDMVPFSLVGSTLQFEPPDHSAFPALGLAYEAGRAGGIAPAVYNAADEVAVAAFLQRRVGFRSIPEIIERTLDAVEPRSVSTVDDVLGADREAREVAASLVGSC